MPSIALIQSAGNVVSFPAAPGPGVVVTMGQAMTAGSLLCAFYTGFDNPSVNFNAVVAITDTSGNTWLPFGYTAWDKSAGSAWMRGYYCASAVGGGTVITATVTNASWLAVAMTVMEFSRPATLIPFAFNGTNTDSQANPTLTGAMTLPGPGLIASALQSNRTDMVIDPTRTFTSVPDQPVTGANLYAGYALNPNGTVQCGWNRTGAPNTSRGGAILMGFLDTAGFAARPKPLGGKGASW